MAISTFGEVKSGRDFEEWFFRRRSPEQRLERQYLEFEAAYAEAVANQGEDWDPKKPETPGAKLLIFGVKEALRMITVEPDPQVLLYRLVDSRFDAFHGADAAIEYQGARVYLDVTMWREKQMRHRPRSSEYPFVIVTYHHARTGRLGQIGYYAGLQLLKSLMRKNYRRYLSDLVVQDSSGRS